MTKTYNETSPQFKRAIHAFSFAMSLLENIDDEEERFFMDNLIEYLDGEIGDVFSVIDFVDKRFKDYEEYEQISRGYYTGVWYQKMQKEDGTTFERGFYGNDLGTPNPNASFMDKGSHERYDAKQLYAFFVPHNSPPGVLALARDETNHIAMSLEEISPDGDFNSLAKSTCDFAQVLNECAAKHLIREANEKDPK